MANDVMMTADVCGCTKCDELGHPKAVERAMTAEEMAVVEKIRFDSEQRQAEEKAEADRIAALKESAKAKLIAGEPLTEEEASVLVI